LKLTEIIGDVSEGILAQFGVRYFLPKQQTQGFTQFSKDNSSAPYSPPVFLFTILYITGCGD